MTICHATICQTHEDVYSTLMFSLLLSYPNKDNWALIRAQQLAAKEELPLHVCFCLVVPKSELSTLRHYAFLLRGLQEVATVPLCVFSQNRSNECKHLVASRCLKQEKLVQISQLF